MPARLTPQQAAELGLHASGPQRLSPQEAAELGLHEQPSAPPGKVPDTLTEEGGLSHGPGTSFALNALDSLSVVGLPTTLALKDALTAGPAAGDFRTRYGKAKEFYEKGMDRLGKANPKTAVVGQLAPIVTPGGAAMKGASFAGTVGRGAVSGALAGLARGPSKVIEKGDFEGAAKDTAIGAGAGGLLAGGGALIGKGVEFGGNLARKGMGRVLAEVKKRTASDIGTAKNLAGQAAGAVENAWNANAMRNAGPGGIVPGLAHRDPVQVARNLSRREGNIERALDVEQNLFDKYGKKLRPPIRELNAKHLGEMGSEATGHLKGAITAGALGYAGYKGAEAAGVDPRIGAAIGGAGGLYAVRKISQAAASHPETLQKLMNLRPIGQALARLGGKGASVPKNVGAIVYALRDDPEVKKILSEFAASSSAAR